MVAPVVFSPGFKVAFVATWKVSCGELRDCFTRCTNPQLYQLVAKCVQILCMTSCEFNERAREVKICWQSRPALYYSQQQVDRARWKTWNMSRDRVKVQIWPGLNANKIQIPCGKHHEVSSFVRSHLNTHNSVKYEVISKCQVTRPNMKY